MAIYAKGNARHLLCINSVRCLKWSFKT